MNLHLRRAFARVTPHLGGSIYATADEVNDLNAITFAQNCFHPLIAAHDSAVQFDRHSLRSNR